MKLSQKGMDLLIQREGKRLQAYRDSKGIWTIGVGHTGPEVHEGLRWTDKEVIEAFEHDVEWAEKAVSSVSIPLAQHQFDALVSFVFNVGAFAWHKSTMKKLLNAGLWQAAAEQFDRWRFPSEIIGRRMSEKRQFLGQ